MIGIARVYRVLGSFRAVAELWEPPLAAETIRGWLKAGKVPEDRCEHLSAATGVSIADLNPEYWETIQRLAAVHHS